MSPTSTSDLEHEDAMHRITTYFILRRGRGSALSSRDTDALETWARQGHTWVGILQAINTAFAKMRTPPHSIRACGPYLEKTTRSDDLLDPDILAAVFGQPEASKPDKPAMPAAAETVRQPAAVERALTHLKQCAQQTNDARAKCAYLGLHNDIRERAETGPIDPDTIAIFDEALALLGLEQISAEQRQGIEGAVDRATAAMRTRTLLELVGQALDLEYPLAGRLHRRR